MNSTSASLSNLKGVYYLRGHMAFIRAWLRWKVFDRLQAYGDSLKRPVPLTLTVMKGVLTLMKWAKLKTAASVGAGVLIVGVATAPVQQAVADGPNIKLPPEVREQLEKQRTVLQAVRFEFNTAKSGTLTNFDYTVTQIFSAYFEGRRFLLEEQLPGRESYNDKVAFDGQTIWWPPDHDNRVRKASLADAAALIPFRFREWPYLEAASIHAPGFISELERFSSLEPCARHNRGDLTTTKPEYDKFSVYFNLDSGTGKIRGIHQAGNVAVGPIFDAWMGPFKDIGMKTVALSDIGGGDNHAFTRVGLPSFGLIQDPIEYSTRTWHTSADVYERLQPEDLQFNSAVVASFAWHAAQRDEKLSRWP